MLYSEMTDTIINSFYKVYNVLDYGFLEKVYENALVIELDIEFFGKFITNLNSAYLGNNFRSNDLSKSRTFLGTSEIKPCPSKFIL